MAAGGGRFDFDDGGTYCGGWEDGKAHGQGVCTGPKGQGEYSGAWQYGYEISGVYTWPSGNCFEGTWLQGKRHGLGVETKGRWIYRGEWTQGFKGRYGVRQSTNSGAKYEGTWTTGLQDGYGVETYADGGTYQGQWLRGTRHGYGARSSVPYGLASHYRPSGNRASLTSLRSEAEDDNVVKARDRKLDESRGGFVLKARSDDESQDRLRRISLFDKHGRHSLRKSIMSGLKLKKQRSTGDINDSPRRPTGSVRSTVSNISHTSMNSDHSAMTMGNMSRLTDSNLSFITQDDITDINVTETYLGEWKNDKRSGFGVSERSDGLKYEGEWYNNKKFGYGVTVFPDGAREEGKYKNNVLISSGKKSKLFIIRSTKLRERVDNAVSNAQRASQIAMQKADIAISRMANARAKAEQADMAAEHARADSDIARIRAKDFAPEFHQPGTELMKKRMEEYGDHADMGHMRPVHNHAPHRSKSAHASHASHAHSPRHHAHEDMEERMYDEPTHAAAQQRPQMMTALSTAMDCAIAGSTSGIGNSMNQLQHAGTDGGGTSRDARDARDGRGPAPPPDQYLRPKREGGSDGGLKESPVRSNSFRRRNSASYKPKESVQDLLTTNILQDHFDQYRTLDSGLGRELDDMRYRHSADPSPDSGVSDSDDLRSGTKPRNRRKTLPSFMQDQLDQQQKVLRSDDDVSRDVIIENGIKKKVEAEVHSARPRPSRLKLSRDCAAIDAQPRSKGPRGSLPDVSQCSELKKDVMPREEVSKLSSARRQQLIATREEEERRRRGDIVIRLSDLKDWCYQRQLLMVVIAVNVSLATVFFNLLSNQ